MPTLASRPTVLASCGLLAAAALLSGCGGGSATPAVSPSPPASSSPSALPTSPSPATPTPSTPAATTPATTTSRTPVAAAPGACPTSQLGISVRADAGGGAAGSTYESVVFINQGGVTCTLDGYPGVSYVVGTDGHQVGAAAARQGTPALVSLAPGVSAHVQLRVVNYGNYDLAACQPSPVEGFRIYPPNQTAAAFVAAPGTTCADPSVVLLTVGPVQPGASG